MENDFITRNEHAEFVKRIDAENARQNKRIDVLETAVRELQEIPFLVKQVISNQDSMNAEIKLIGKRLEDVEKQPIKIINNSKQTAINAVVNLLTNALVIGLAALIISNLK